MAHRGAHRNQLGRGRFRPRGDFGRLGPEHQGHELEGRVRHLDLDRNKPEWSIRPQSRDDHGSATRGASTIAPGHLKRRLKVDHFGQDVRAGPQWKDWPTVSPARGDDRQGSGPALFVERPSAFRVQDDAVLGRDHARAGRRGRRERHRPRVADDPVAGRRRRVRITENDGSVAASRDQHRPGQGAGELHSASHRTNSLGSARAAHRFQSKLPLPAPPSKALKATPREELRLRGSRLPSSGSPRPTPGRRRGAARRPGGREPDTRGRSRQEHAGRAVENPGGAASAGGERRRGAGYIQRRTSSDGTATRFIRRRQRDPREAQVAAMDATRPVGAPPTLGRG